jgi:hypothetical protein
MVIKMKRKLYFALVLFFTSVFGLSMVGCLTNTQVAPESYSLPDLIGVWEGSYFANQGETGLTLTVWEEKGNYKATFYFYNLLGRTNTALLPVGVDGNYYMNVTSNNSTRKYNLVGYEWIDIPNVPGTYWVFVDLEGIVNGNVFSGNAMHTSGGSGLTFRVVKK